VIEIPPPRKRKPFSWPLVLRLGGRALAGIGLALVLALVAFPERHQTCGFCFSVQTGSGGLRFVRFGTRGSGVREDVAFSSTGFWSRDPQVVPAGGALESFRLRYATGICGCKRHPSFGEWADWMKARLTPPAPVAVGIPNAVPAVAPIPRGTRDR